MIVYDTYAFAGLKVFLHMTGSALFSVRSLLPALLSALLAALLANYEPIRLWLSQRVIEVGLSSLGIQFLVTLVLVNRIQLANMRFRAAHKIYADFHYTLLRLGTLLTGCLDSCANQDVCPQVLAEFRAKYLRWIRAVHILTLEELRGFETPQYRMGVLLFTEEIMLFRESRRAARVIRWLTRAYHGNRALIAPGTAIDGRMMQLLDDVLLTYGNVIVASNQVYPFPLTQTCFMCVVMFALAAPLLCGIMMPHSLVLAPLLSFTAVWIAFGLNLSAQLMEWPFDGKANDLPFAYFGMRFMREIGEIEFGTDAPLLAHTLAKLLPKEEDSDDDEVDYVVPQQRAHVGSKRRELKAWMEDAVRDMDNSLQSRQRLRSHLRPIHPLPRTAPSPNMGNTMSEIRATGRFKVLI